MMWTNLRRRLSLDLAALAVLAVTSTSLPAERFSTFYSTGVDDSGNSLGDTANDPHYSIAGPAAAVTVPNDGFPIPPWLANDATSRWISVTGDPDANADPSTYAYTTSFDIPDHLDPANAAIVGWWSADDAGAGIQLNGAGLPVAPTAGFNARAWFGLNSQSATAAGGALQQAGNTVVFNVVNGGEAANPTGLRVGGIYAHAAPKGTVRIPGIYNTGVDDNGLPLADGAADPHYTMTVAPEGTVDPATALAGPPSPPWVQNSSSSRWIGPNNDVGGNGPAGNYEFEITFDLTGLDPSSAVIQGLWSLDNDDQGVGILLNGVPTGNNQVGSFPELTPFSISVADGDTFNPGLNTLTFPVFNAGETANPIGLRVEGVVAYAMVPEPHTLTLLVAGGLGMLAVRRRQRG